MNLFEYGLKIRPKLERSFDEFLDIGDHWWYIGHELHLDGIAIQYQLEVKDQLFYYEELDICN